jgi:hypothetical protein
MAIQRRAAARNTNSDTAAAKRVTRNTAVRTAELAWEQEHDKSAFDPAWFRTQIQPALADFSLTQIAKETGMSTAAASRARARKTVPHPRHWAALACLIGLRREEYQVRASARTGTEP